MAEAALAARVVEVIADLGPSADARYRYGSGCIVRGRTVLTAAHVVADVESVVVRDLDKREYVATVDPRFVGDAEGPDLALVEIEDPNFKRSLPPIGLAAIDRDSETAEPVERCHAVGYPWFAETRSRTRSAVRDTVDAIGVVPVLSKLAAGLLSVQVTVAPRELPPEGTALGASEWSGMSGAPVYAGGCLLGVVTEHAPRDGPSAITAVPLTALQADRCHEKWGQGVADPAAWWSRLGVRGIGDLQRLPQTPPSPQLPAYRATLREFGRALHQRMPQLLGREQELTKIAAFATCSEGYRWRVGGAFAGKTALLYEVVTVGLPHEVDVVCYFLSRRASDASGSRFLAAVVPQLAYLCGLDAPEVNVDQYYALWELAFDRAVESGRHLLLVVDGLDEDFHVPRSPSVASLLPTLIGSHAHVLVSSRPRPGLPNDVAPGHPLKMVTPVRLDPFKGAQKLAELATKEIDDLTEGKDADLAVDVLGLLTAAAGPLSVRDLVALRSDGQGVPAVVDTRHVRRLVEKRAARSLERVGPADAERYQFAHASLLEHAQAMPDLCDLVYRERIHHWAERWRDAGWPTPGGAEKGTPQYLLDTYSSTLTQDPQRLAQMVSDIGWAAAAIPAVGVDRVLADLHQAASANPATTTIAPVLAAVTGQAHNLRPPQPVDQPGYILRQLCMQAAELCESGLAAEFRLRLQSQLGPCLIPLWTTRRASHAFSGELARREGHGAAIAELPGNRIVTGGSDGRILVWDRVSGTYRPTELGRHDGLRAVDVLNDGRVITVGSDHRVLAWNPAAPDSGPVELGRHEGPVSAVTVLADGRVVTGGDDHQVLAWDPFAAEGLPGRSGRQATLWPDPDEPVIKPTILGSHARAVQAVVALPGTEKGVASTGSDRKLLVWNTLNGRRRRIELGRTFGPARVLAVLPDGRLITGGAHDEVMIWDPRSPDRKPTLLGRHNGGLTAIAAVSDTAVVTGGRDGRILVWNSAQPRCKPAELGRHGTPVLAVTALSDGRVATGGTDGRILMWDISAASLAPSAELISHDDRTLAAGILDDGRIVTGSSDGRVLIWDPDGRSTEMGRLAGWVWAVAVLPNGNVATGGPGGALLVWDPAVPVRKPIEVGRHNGGCSLAVLPDGHVATVGFDGRVLEWDPTSIGCGPTEWGRYRTALSAVAALADGSLVTLGAYGHLLKWDRAAPERRPIELGHHDGARSLAVLPDGHLVTAGSDLRVLGWDPATQGRGPVELGRHDGSIRTMAATHDGLLVTGGSDQVLVWDPGRDRDPCVQLVCSAIALCTGRPTNSETVLLIAHQRTGMSLWSIKNR